VCGAESREGGGLIHAAGLVSGIASFDRVGYLVGVFLPTAAPTGSPPPSLDSDGTYDLAAYSPRLAQIFFIGDGRAADGSLQRFNVPKGATRLYLGFADAYGFTGPPGYYGDNSGFLKLWIGFLASPTPVG
jgi:hypothetical protein